MAYRRPEPLHSGHEVDAFNCGSALDEWLKEHARAAQASGSARILVVTTDGTSVVGYCALAAAQVAPQAATERARRGQPGHRPIPAILLVRLGVDRDHQCQGLGRSLLQDVMLRCLDAAEAIGARVLLVHAKDEQARASYQRYGFEESPTDPLHLMMLLKDMRAFLTRVTREQSPKADTAWNPPRPIWRAQSTHAKQSDRQLGFSRS